MYTYRSKPVQYTLLKSLALNGVAYLGILVILETFYNTPDHHLFGYSYTVSFSSRLPIKKKGEMRDKVIFI